MSMDKIFKFIESGEITKIMEDKGRPNSKLLMLYSHWCAADSIKVSISSPMLGAEKLGDEGLANVAVILSSFYRVLIYYALLYVVVEAYKQSGDQFPGIDAILAESDAVEDLRRLRNAIFHVQEEPFNPKLWTFLLAGNSEKWIMRLNQEFEKYFQNRLPIKEVLNAAKGKL
jgi:hypothetical protein